MKFTSFLAVAAVWLSVGLTSFAEDASGKVLCLPKGEAITTKDLCRATSACDVLVLGEIHDSDAVHRLQLEILKELLQEKRPILISCEMFERDVQETLDLYLAGKIEEEEFLKRSRPWSNYKEHYRPIVELARANGVRIVAANFPKPEIQKLLSGEKPDERYYPKRVEAPKDVYWKKFVEAFAANPHGHGGENATYAFYCLQCIKDSSMAEAIASELDKEQERSPLVVHLCGSFHSDYGYGTVERLHKCRPLTRVQIVTSAYGPAELKRDEIRALSEKAHFALVVPKNE